jgi:coenzyme A diphosphatase NUDT7
MQLREAHEEVALPLSSPHVHPLCLLRPFLSLNKLWVTPVVSLLSNTTVLDSLVASPDEVERIFTHPLNALLDPSLARDEPLVEIGSEDWPYDDELHVCFPL